MERNCFGVLVPLMMILAIHATLRAQTGALHGTLAGFGGARMTDATVRVSDSAYFRSADIVDGVFSIPDLAPGIYTLHLWAPGFIAQEYEMTIRAGYRARIAMCLYPVPSRPTSETTSPATTTPPAHLRSHESISPDDVQRSARASIRSAIALNSGVTTAGVNGIALRGYGGGLIELIPDYEPMELPQGSDVIGAMLEAHDPVLVIDSVYPDEPLGRPDTSVTAAPPNSPAPAPTHPSAPLLR